jgi:tRNA 2-thiouridine synthesizing protein A
MTLVQDVSRELDITSDVCPMTFVRTRIALDQMAPGELLLVKLKGEEPSRNVPQTVAAQGHEILVTNTDADGVCHLLIRRGP